MEAKEGPAKEAPPGIPPADVGPLMGQHVFQVRALQPPGEINAGTGKAQQKGGGDIRSPPDPLLPADGRAEVPTEEQPG